MLFEVYVIGRLFLIYGKHADQVFVVLKNTPATSRFNQWQLDINKCRMWKEANINNTWEIIKLLKLIDRIWQI